MIEGNPSANGTPGRPGDLAEHEEALTEMAAELEVVRTKASALELEVKALKREIRRIRRNVGYRVTHGIGKVFTSIIHLPAVLRIAPVGHTGRPRPNGIFTLCSRELRTLVQELAAEVKSAFYLTPSAHHPVLHSNFLRHSVRQFCSSEDDLLKEMTSGRFLMLSSVQPQMNGAAAPEFAKQDLVIIDAAHQGRLWPMFLGRFWPHQRILIHGKADDIRAFIGPHQPSRQGPDFAFFFAPPWPWLDPRHPSEPAGRPWKSRMTRVSASLPSGKPWPRISVVTPSFNQGQFVEATIQSVLRQSYPNLEYLVLDGGSTDTTQLVLQKYRKELSFCCSEKDDGQADAINKGFSRSTGEILAWLNSDDQYAPDALARVAVAFDLFPEADVVVGGCGLLQQATGSLSHVHHSSLPIGAVVPMPLERLLDLENCWLKGHFFYQPEVFWRRGTWDAIGGAISEDLNFSFDYELWVRMARAGAKVVHIPDLLSLYRVHPAQKTYGADLPYVPELRAVNARLRHKPVPAKVLISV